MDGSMTYAVESLISPKLPAIVEAKRSLRDADTPPGAEDKNPECVLRVSDLTRTDPGEMDIRIRALSWWVSCISSVRAKKFRFCRLSAG